MKRNSVPFQKQDMCHLILKTALESDSNKHDSSFVPKGDMQNEKKKPLESIMAQKQIFLFLIRLSKWMNSKTFKSK